MTTSDDGMYVNSVTAIGPHFRSLGHRISKIDAHGLLVMIGTARATAPLQAPPRLRIAEVGSFVGLTTAIMAIYGKPETIYAIDTWKGSSDREDIVNSVYAEHGREFIVDTFDANVAPYRTIVIPVCGPSVKVASTFPDSSFDMVFIDADHRYEAVKSDIDAWLPKVREGGVLCGHDYTMFSGVKRAVDEYGFASLPPSSLWFFQK